MERAVETRTCGVFYAGKRKQGGSLHTQGVWERMMKGQRDAGWIDAVLEEAEDYRAIAGFSLLDDHASGEFVRLY